MKVTQKKLLLLLVIFMGIITASYSQQTKLSSSDTAFIMKNIKDNRMEMQLSQLGADKGESAIRKIARQMLFDHGKIIEDLADVAKKNNLKGVDIDGSATAGTDDGNTPAISTSDTSAGTASGSGTTGANGTAGASTTNANAMQGNMTIPTLDDLGNATGAEFSKMWLQYMTAMHKAKLAELQAATKTISDPDLLSAVNKAIPKIQAHLDMLAKANP